jgi:hypothetical protein
MGSIFNYAIEVETLYRIYWNDPMTLLVQLYAEP